MPRRAVAGSRGNAKGRWIRGEDAPIPRTPKRCDHLLRRYVGELVRQRLQEIEFRPVEDDLDARLHAPFVVTEVAAFCVVGAPSSRSASEAVFLHVKIKPPRDVLVSGLDCFEDRPLRCGRVFLLGSQRPVGHIDRKNANPRALRRGTFLPSTGRARRVERVRASPRAHPVREGVWGTRKADSTEPKKFLTNPLDDPLEPETISGLQKADISFANGNNTRR